MDYWIIVGDSHAGPFTLSQLAERNLGPNELVWAPGMPDWAPAASVAEINEYFTSRQPQPQPQPQPSPQPARQPELQHEAQAAPQPEPTPQPVGQSAPAYEPQPTPAAAPTYQQPEPTPQPLYVQQPVGVGVAEAMPKCPPAALAWSIIVTILCCVPLGVAAIFCSAQVKTAYARGNYPRAERFSEAAQWLVMLAIVFGLLWIPFSIMWMSF